MYCKIKERDFPTFFLRSAEKRSNSNGSFAWDQGTWHQSCYLICPLCHFYIRLISAIWGIIRSVSSNLSNCPAVHMTFDERKEDRHGSGKKSDLTKDFNSLTIFLLWKMCHALVFFLTASVSMVCCLASALFDFPTNFDQYVLNCWST